MLRKITAIISMAAIVPLMASNFTHKEALIVAIDHYKNGDRLPGIGSDVKRMKTLLESRGFHVKVLYNEQATKDNVINTLKSYRTLSSSDSFAFYDTTHGTQVPDINGDESDGKDEAYVLYDATKDYSSEKGLLIDDELDNILASISAKKVMITDACHSGSMYKGLSRNAKEKFVPISPNFKYVNKSTVIGSIKKPKNLVALGASSDDETSIATSSGSLFTEALYDAWSNNPNITFKEAKELTHLHIKDACSHDANLKPFTPTLYATNINLVNNSMDDFLNVNITINPKKDLVEDYLDNLIAQGKVGNLKVSTKDYYAKGESIKLNIDTLGKKGHLYIITTKTNQNSIDVLYPNPYYKDQTEQVSGSFDFPSKAKLKYFDLKADNQTGKLERTVVYVILSQSIIPELEKSRSIGYDHFQSIIKDFKSQVSLKNAIKDILIKKKDNQISIGKVSFNVGA